MLALVCLRWCACTPIRVSVLWRVCEQKAAQQALSMGQINIRRALSLCSTMWFYNLTWLVCVYVCLHPWVHVHMFLGVHMLI